MNRKLHIESYNEYSFDITVFTNNNANSFFEGMIRNSMGRYVFIKEIITITKEPQMCPTCEKDDRLEKDIIREEKTDAKTILCHRCEALTVITNQNIRNVQLSSKRTEDIVMLKEPHLIRRVGI